MSQTLSSQRQDLKIAQRIADLERAVNDLRTNQARKLSFNGITLDGTGDNGSMSASDTPIITDTGLVSATNFPLDEVNDNPSAETTSTTMVDLPGSSMDAFTTKGTTNVLISVAVGGHASNFTVDGSLMEFQVHDSIDETVISSTMAGTWELTNILQDETGVTGWSTNTIDEVVSLTPVIQLAAGSHTLKLQYRVSGTGNASVNFFYLGYIVLGQQV